MRGCEWRLHSHEEEEVGAPFGTAVPPPIYRGVGAPSPHALESTSLLPPAAPTFGYSFGEAMAV